MSLQELRTPVKRKSLFDQGYDWALQEHKEGVAISTIRVQAENAMDYNDFDRGAEAACDFLEAQLRAEFDAET
jgi:hypothetical protein